MLLAGTGGCLAGHGTFQVVDYREGGQEKRYAETFPEAYYCTGPGGNVEIVLRRRQPSDFDPRLDITQVIHLKTVWRSIPGETVAESTQINATVSYLIVSGKAGATFEGAGSVFFRENRQRDRLDGSLDLAMLRPTRRLAVGNPIFERATLQGRFEAVRNRRKVVRLLNEMNRLFGPLPLYEEQPATP